MILIFVFFCNYHYCFKESEILKQMANSLRMRADDLRSASRGGFAGGPGEDVGDLVKYIDTFNILRIDTNCIYYYRDLETVIADLAPIIDMSTTLRIVRQEDLSDTVEHHRIAFKVLTRKYWVRVFLALIQLILTIF